MGARQVDCPAGIVSRRWQACQAMSGWYVLFTSPIWKSVVQPYTEMARPVLFSTTTRAGMDDPAFIVCDGSISRAESGVEGEPDEMWLPLEHPAAMSASTVMNFFTSP
jgi:hypothetical protein